MRDISGDFEIHLTGAAAQAAELAAFGARHGLKFVHIELDRGRSPSQPMLTLAGRGPGAEQQAVLRRWVEALRAAQLYVNRAKVEATPWSEGVPESDADARDEPADRYFEHHVKLLLRPGEAVAALDAYGARLSRNARRDREDGRQERFVTQRCHGVGRATAQRRLDELLAALRGAAHEIVEVEREYVVFDDNLQLDRGWITDLMPSGSKYYPPTYRPVPHATSVFDPAMKQYANAYRAGEPEFPTAAGAERWTTARRAAMHHVLDVVLGTPWAPHLVLRGSVTLAAWVGAAAREPGDLDFVVTPPTLTSDCPEATALLRGLKQAVREHPGAGLRPGDISESAIWTYERADGRRLVVPFEAPGHVDGHVQIDIVFGEELPLPPAPVALPGVERPVLAAPAPLSLAWKLLWLATDSYPQGKDLYDAVLLAEYTTVPLALVRELMRPELGAEAGTFTAAEVTGWPVDWDNFRAEHPAVTGTLVDWKRRLVAALERGWGDGAPAGS